MRLVDTAMNGSAPRQLALVAALEREVAGLTRNCTRVQREHQGRKFIFFEQDDMVIVCGGIGMEPARRAAEAMIALYHPLQVRSVGFAGALQPALRVGDVLSPAAVVDARDGSRVETAGGDATLVTFMAVATMEQKIRLAQAYNAQAVDMEAAAVAAAARARGISFTATKVISDGLHFEMPETANFIDPQGRFQTLSFVIHVALRPWLWRRVARLARNTNKAAGALAEHLDGLRRHPVVVVEAPM